MRVITESLKVTFDRGWGLLNQVIDVCPNDVWDKKAGGFLFWQQVYHCFGCVDFFISGEEKVSPDDAVMFKPVPSMSKDEVRAFGAKMKAKADAWISALDDDSLGVKNESVSARFGMPMTNVATFSLMIGHSMYHIGSCDAILRDNGQKGVM